MKKQVLLAISTLAISLLVIEVGLRVYYATRVGPSVLWYGTSFHRQDLRTKSSAEVDADPIPTKAEAKHFRDNMTREQWLNKRTVIQHQNHLAGYSKYHPNEKRFDFDIETGERFQVGINAHGFRGRDWDVKKAAGVLRVVTLGASSTFGYFDRDNETYPYYLELELNQRLEGGVRVEVINLGIPHQTALQIRELFVAEALPLDPDIVTFYEGTNDAAKIEDLLQQTPVAESGSAAARGLGALRSAIRSVGSYSIAMGLLESMLETGARGQHALEEVLEHSGKIRDEFIAEVAAIQRECDARGILFILANQQKNSELVSRQDRKGMTYVQELEIVHSMLRRSEELGNKALGFAAHAVMMTGLKDWAETREIPFVDVIKRLDHNRDVMVSWVHLSPDGNRMVAQAFAEEIVRRVSARPTPGSG